MRRLNALGRAGWIVARIAVLVTVTGTLVMGVAGSARAAEWTPPEVFGTTGGSPLEGVTDGAGSVLGLEFDPSRPAQINAVRRVPGKPTVTMPLNAGRERGWRTAAGPDGTLAAMVLEDVDASTTKLVVYSWSRGAERPVVTTPVTFGPIAPELELSLAGDGTFTAVIQTSTITQVHGTLGGTPTSEPLPAADGGEYTPEAMTLVRGPGGPASLVIFDSDGRLLLSRATNGKFGPATVAGQPRDAETAPLSVIEVDAQRAADGTIGVAFVSVTASQPSPGTWRYENGMWGARISAAGVLQDAQLIDTAVRQHTSPPPSPTGTALYIGGLGVNAAGDETLAWIEYDITDLHGSQAFAARRLKGDREFGPTQTLAELSDKVVDVAGVVARDGSARIVGSSGGSVVEWIASGTGAFGAPRTLLGADAPGDTAWTTFWAGTDAAYVGAMKDDGVNRIRQLDLAGPALSVEEPRRDPDGTYELRATATDGLSGPPVVTWDLGDGTKASGEVVRHRFAPGRRYEVVATATDLAGESSSVRKVIDVAPDSPPVGPPSPPAPDRSAPVLTNVKLAAARVKRGRSATLRFTSSEAGTLRVVVQRSAPGVRRGKKCVAGKAKGRAKKCTRTLTLRTVTAPLRAGVGRLKLATKGFPVARLSLRVSATDAAGNTSASTVRRLTVSAR